MSYKEELELNKRFKCSTKHGTEKARKIFFQDITKNSPDFVQKIYCRTQVRTPQLLDVINFLFHCAISHLIKMFSCEIKKKPLKLAVNKCQFCNLM